MTAKELTAKEFSFIGALLVSAFEGGSNYWYTIVSHNKKESRNAITCLSF